MNNDIYYKNNYDDYLSEFVYINDEEFNSSEDENKFHEITVTIIDDYNNELRRSKELTRSINFIPPSNQTRLLNKFIGIFGNKKERLKYLHIPPSTNEYELDVKKFITHSPGFITKKIMKVENPSDPSQAIFVQEEIVLDLNRTPLFIEDVKFTDPRAEDKGNVPQEIFDSLLELEQMFGKQALLNTSYFFHQGLAPKFIEEYNDQNEARIQKRMEKEEIFELPLSGEMKLLQVNRIESDTISKAKFTIQYTYTIKDLKMNEAGKEPEIRGFISVQYEILIPIDELNQNWEEEKNISKVMPGLEVIKYVSQEHVNEKDAQNEVNGQILRKKISEAFPFDKLFKVNQKFIVQQFLSANGKFVNDNSWSSIDVRGKEIVLQEIFLAELKNVAQAPIVNASLAGDYPDKDYLSCTINMLYRQFGEEGLKNISCFLHRGIVPNITSLYEGREDSQLFVSDNHFEFNIEELENFSMVKFTIDFHCKLKKYSNKNFLPEDLGFVAGKRVVLFPRHELEKSWVGLDIEEVAPNLMVVDQLSHLTPNLDAAKLSLNNKSNRLNELIENSRFSDF